ncbi:outer membrane protein OmpA-like peptidoglycan-associated protein [Chryseobacterium defluvii]|uniref:Outer membrane protein OmpA-like peptidoglycan-associated protein n=1 Tax=Chryseobacterium defluvii TaxID=160396 RepID=A0A840KAF5_9FLAO|nr:OmpA family protein [Chryseobacterium defluvii]MBB4804987.1 outer membrane protein OmpA-like peptidoglycan-associated protein [Chryseobacterium defluvii]
MSLNIIDLIKGQLGPALVSQAASQLGESESGISKAIGGLLPAVVGGLANNADNPGVLDAISNASSSGILGNLLGNSSNNSIISSLLSAIFGDKVGGLVNTIATFAGISNNSSSSLLNLVTGAALGSVGKYAADNNLGQSGISSLLGDQKGIISTLLPAGLSLASLNLGSWFGNDDDKVKVSSYDEPKVEVTRSTTPTNSYNDNNNDGSGGGSIWKWLLPLLLLLAAGYFLWKQCEKKDAATTTTTADSTGVSSDTAAVSADTSAVTTAKVDEDIDLNGIALKGYKGGMEDKMIAFLKSDDYKNAKDDAALKDIWYDFDHVNFKIGSATELEAGSQGQLDNLVAILKAFPDAKIKIGGYTDKTGNEADNVKLSKGRAEFIKAALTKAGVGAQVLEAEGYGSKFATVDASASNEARAVDRKMAVRFAK